jgi:hypothetical protein
MLINLSNKTFTVRNKQTKKEIKNSCKLSFTIESDEFFENSFNKENFLITETALK